VGVLFCFGVGERVMRWMGRRLIFLVQILRWRWRVERLAESMVSLAIGCDGDGDDWVTGEDF
jgi:hypothetical protein